MTATPPPIPPSASRTLQSYVQSIRLLQGSFLDAYVIVDSKGTVVSFNRPFFSLLPKRLARRLEGRALHDLFSFRWNHDAFNPLEECLSSGRSVRYNEVEGHIAEREGLFNFMVAATPLLAQPPEASSTLGALVVLRDVTDEAQVQTKYKHMLRDEALARAELESLLKTRTEELLRANEELNNTHTALIEYKKGLRIDP